MQSVGGVPRPSRIGTGPLALFGDLWRHRQLVLMLARRDVLSRYQGSLLGPLWAFGSPVLLLAVYTFVFSSIFRARWDIEIESRAGFALMLFAGLIVYWLFAETVNRAPGLMFENPSYIKRIVFPLEMLPWTTLVSGLFRAGVSTLVLVSAHLLLIGPCTWTVLLLPILIAPVALLALGTAWLLASLGVYFRDLREIVPVLTTVLLFLSPIFYPVSALPERVIPYLGYNPLAQTLTDFRGALFAGRGPNWEHWALSLGVAWLFAWLALAWFRRVRTGFADVL